MATLTRIREFASLIPDDEISAVCGRIIEEVAKRAQRDNIGLWTIDVISKWLGREPADPTVIRSVQLLTTRLESQLLEMHFIFHDPRDTQGAGELVEDDEVQAAYQSGYLVHPVTGERVDNFESVLLPYFVPSTELKLQ
jgi:hypothetical protein